MVKTLCDFSNSLGFLPTCYDWLDLAMGVLFTAVGLFVVFLIIGAIVFDVIPLFFPWNKTLEFKLGVVKDISYVASSSSIGHGVTTGGKGVVTYSLSPSQYNVVVRLDDGEKVEIDDEAIYDLVKEGDRVKVSFRSKTLPWVSKREACNISVEKK